MIDDDAVAVDAERTGVDHFACIRRLYGRGLNIAEIKSEVHLLIHLLAFIGVGPLVGKKRFDLADAEERALPKHGWLSLPSKVCQRLIILTSHLAVDFEKSIDQLPRPARVEFVHYFL